MASTPQVELPPTTVHDDPYLVPTAPATPTPVEQIVEALKTIKSFEGLTDSEYRWLAIHGAERMAPEGALIFREGDCPKHMSVILRGEIHVRRRHSGPLALFIGRAGQVTGRLPYSRMKAYGGDGYSVNSSWVFDIHESLFQEMLAAIPSMGQRCVSVLLDRVREVTRMEGQAEKLAALGKLAGNLSHELNNPASAAQRSAASLYGQLRHYGDQKYKLGNLRLSEEQTGHYQSWIRRTRERMTDITAHSRINPSLLSETDREEQLSSWLAAHNVPEPWNVAAAFAENFIGIEQLEEYAAVADSNVLPLTISTLASSLRAERMAETVVDATVRIFDLISAIKSYSYMDQAAIQDVDLAQSLEATLSMLGSRLHDVTIEREFDPELAPVSAYGSELTQVWTVLIENALDAMADNEGPRVLKLTTHNAAGMAYVEIWDNGHGVDQSIASRIFEPFFTTKAVGSGLGLGLDTAQRIVARHSGFLTVESKPGKTCFQVRLPFDQVEAY